MERARFCGGLRASQYKLQLQSIGERAQIKMNETEYNVWSDFSIKSSQWQCHINSMNQ